MPCENNIPALILYPKTGSAKGSNVTSAIIMDVVFLQMKGKSLR